MYGKTLRQYMGKYIFKKISNHWLLFYHENWAQIKWKQEKFYQSWNQSVENQKSCGKKISEIKSWLFEINKIDKPLANKIRYLWYSPKRKTQIATWGMTWYHYRFYRR